MFCYSCKQTKVTFRKDCAAIESYNETIEDSDELTFYEDNGGLNNNTEETSDLNCESKKTSGKKAQHMVNRFDIYIDSNVPVMERIETEED